MKQPSNQTFATQKLSAALTKALQTLELPLPESIHFEHPNNPDFGDYSSNVALAIFGTLDKTQTPFKNPRDLAQAIHRQLETENTSADFKVTVAGPGFINFTFTSEFLLQQMKDVVNKEFHIAPLKTKRRLVVEYTQPNPFKEMHIGHLYNNIVGETLCRLFEAIGAEVRRANYQGDVGMHVAKCIWGMFQKFPELDAQKPVADHMAALAEQPLSQRMKFIGQAYALGATAFEENEAAKNDMKQINLLVFKAAQERLIEQENWQPQVDYSELIPETEFNYQDIKLIYEQARAWSLEHFEEVYARVGMKFDEYYFEGWVAEYGLKTVREFQKQGIFEESQGAVVFPGEKYGLHTRVFVNSMGLPTYEAKDLGLPQAKHLNGEYDESYILVGNEIDEYFKVVLTALNKMLPDLAQKTQHIPYGMVKLPEGKMSSRTGKIIGAEWLLDEVHNLAFKALDKARFDNEAQQHEIAEKIALAAVKYAFLKSDIGNDIIFNFEESLNFHGNSGPYLLYTHVRAQSILHKAETQGLEFAQSTEGLAAYQPNDSEKQILRTLYKYSEAVQISAFELAPHHLCAHLHSLAQSFNTFYTQNPVVSHEVSAETQQFRLLLTRAVAEQLSAGLYLLGITPVAKM